MKTTRKLLLATLLIAAFLLVTAVSAAASDIPASGTVVMSGDCKRVITDLSTEETKEDTTGGDVFWQLVSYGDGTYHFDVSGTGDTYRSINQQTGANTGYGSGKNFAWSEYISKITVVNIGDNIKNIDSGAFVHHSALKTVKLGKNVESLGNAAFEACTNLDTIYRGQSGTEGTYDLTGIKSFGSYLFDGCKKVQNIILPRDGSYSLGTEFLKSNEKMKEIYIPAACKVIHPLAFRNCSALENVYIEGKDTDLRANEVSKESTRFYALPFHACGPKTGSANTVTIQALPDSMAYEFTQLHGTYEDLYVNSSSKTDQKSIYEEALSVDIYNGDSKAFTARVVKGFGLSHEYIDGNSTYVLFEDESCSKLFFTENLADNIRVYCKKLIDAKGFMVRIKEYNGLRAIYEYDTETFANASDYSVVEAGALGIKLCGIAQCIDLEYPGVNKVTVYEGNLLTGKLTKPIEDGIATFASTAVGYEDSGEVIKSRVGADMLFRAYVTVKNNTTGEMYTYYSVQGTKNLDEACEATVASPEFATLSTEHQSFVRDLVALGVDPDRMYTKAEAMQFLTAVYNDTDALLSGQHINFGRYIVRDELNDILYNSGEMPAVLGYDMGTAIRDNNFNLETNTVIADDFAEYARQGGLITFSAHYSNPDPEADTSTGAVRGKLTTLDKWEQLLTENGNIINTNFKSELKQTADFFQMLEDRNVVIFWRPFHETNGAWFWFCGASVPGAGKSNDMSEEYHIRLWEYTYNYFVNERGLSNLIWVYSPNIANDGNNSSAFDVMKYYPGDEFVDVMGVDWYESGKSARDENGAVQLKDTVTLCNDTTNPTTWTRLAGKYNKSSEYPTTSKQMPVVYGEFGPGDSLRDADKNLSFNGAQALELVKEVNAKGYNMGWILFWNGWTDNHLSLDLMTQADVFMNDDFVLTLSEARTYMLDLLYGQ